MNRILGRGEIHVVVGPMFAGKSTFLLNKAKEEKLLGKKIALINSYKDCRFNSKTITTHDGEKSSCFALEFLKEFKRKIGEKEYQKTETLFVDEAQFFPDLLEFCENAADNEGKTLFIAGLDGDFKRNKFGNVLDLIRISDSVVKLQSKWYVCSHPSPFTFRKIDCNELELIGGSEIYHPLCRKHYKEELEKRQKK